MYDLCLLVLKRTVKHTTQLHAHVHVAHTLGLYLISLPRSSEDDFFVSPTILNRPTRPDFFEPPLPASCPSLPEGAKRGSENRSSSSNLAGRPDNFLAPPSTCGSENKSSSRGARSVCLLDGLGEGDLERALRFVDWEWNSSRGPV